MHATNIASQIPEACMPLGDEMHVRDDLVHDKDWCGELIDFANLLGETGKYLTAGKTIRWGRTYPLVSVVQGLFRQVALEMILQDG